MDSLNAADNDFHGGLEFLKHTPDMRHLDVSNNKLSDTASRPVHEHIAAAPELRSYDISGNAFASLGAAPPAPADPTQVGSTRIFPFLVMG